MYIIYKVRYLWIFKNDMKFDEIKIDILRYIIELVIVVL